MKILYDYQIFSSQKYGGISRYFYEIMKGQKYNLPIIFNNNEYLNKSIKIPFNFKGKVRIYNFFNREYSKIYFKFNKNFDIFHPTYYHPYFVKYIKNKPFVLTIHDMIHEKFPNYFSKKDKTIERKKFLAQKANRIIAVSERTKLDIIDILNIPEEKIDVVYHGSDFNLIKEDKEFTKKLPKKYILFTGNRNNYKNFINFIKAVSKFLNKDKNLFIICAGGGSFNNDEIKLFKELKIETQLFQYSCNDGQLKSLYINALFFIFPSLYEGFGIPLLEAMACNTPILCSNVSCFPEIVKDSALMFNPYSVEDIKEKIEFALNNNLDFYIEKGKERFKYFSWDKAREETMDSYKKCF